MVAVKPQKAKVSRELGPIPYEGIFPFNPLAPSHWRASPLARRVGNGVSAGGFPAALRR